MRGSAQTAKPWRSWHRSLRPQTRRTESRRYVLAQASVVGNQVPRQKGDFVIIAKTAKTAKTFRSLLPSCPDFCANVKGAVAPGVFQDDVFFLF